MTEPLCVLTVHAHPDDEASKEPAPSRNTGPREFARCWCAAPGVRRATFSTRRWTVRRSSTTFSRSAVRSSIGPLRSSATTSFTCSAIEIRHAGSDANFHPDCFAVAPHDEAVDRLVAILVQSILRWSSPTRRIRATINIPTICGCGTSPSLRSNGLVTPATAPNSAGLVGLEDLLHDVVPGPDPGSPSGLS